MAISEMRTLRQNTSQTPIILGISIGLFLLLDITMLALNYQITHQVSVDALAINLAGRQRMLSQRMSKAVFQIDESDLASDHSLKLEKEFGKVFNLFTETLNGFEYGGDDDDGRDDDGGDVSGGGVGFCGGSGERHGRHLVDR